MNERMNGNRVAAVLLAAGKSKRFGSNKLLHMVGRKRLIEWSLGTLIDSHPWKIAIVISEEDEFNDVLPKDIIRIVNRSPEDGIGSSISLATRHLEKDVDGLLFTLADQPLLNKSDISALLSEFYRNRNSIIACASEDEVRNPILFPSMFFNELKELNDDKGARLIALRHPEVLLKLPTDASHLLDIDTVEDLKRVEKMLGNDAENY
jgi:CTP:molybdopterin cytidylyltransferase MocA